jgi:hypothetical protein
MFVLLLSVIALTVLRRCAIKSVLKRYNKYAYPGTKENLTVTVKHGLTLMRIVEFVSNVKINITDEKFEDIKWRGVLNLTL